MSHDPIPGAIRKIFGKPPIMAGEDPACYEDLIQSICAEVKPQEFQEWLVTKDIVDAEWELLRLRGLKPSMLHATTPRAIKSLMLNADDTSTLDAGSVAAIRKHLAAVVAGNETARAELERLLEPHGLTLEIAAAAAFEATIVAQLHTDRMAHAAYERRNAAYAELERIRARKRAPDRSPTTYPDEAETAEDAPTTVPSDSDVPPAR